MATEPNRERNVLVGIRTVPKVKAGLKRLAVLMGDELGTKVTQVQVFEHLVHDALKARNETL